MEEEEDVGDVFISKKKNQEMPFPPKVPFLGGGGGGKTVVEISFPFLFFSKPCDYVR